MKLSFALLGFAAADICDDCDAQITTFNSWHNNVEIVCERYTDPRVALDSRGACKECKIQCQPVEDSCPGIEALESGFWNKTGKKVTAQYITRADDMAVERSMQRSLSQFEKETAKYEKIKNKMAEKAAKELNKKEKKEDWEQWREDRRAENEAKRAQRKADKKVRKAAAKAAKALRKEQREAKRALADANKVLFSFYADLEDHYSTVCPELFLIKDNQQARKYEMFKSQLASISE